MRSDNETSHGPSPAKGAFRMRAAHTTRLLVLGGCLGCYVQPYNPPPAQYGATQEQPPQTGQEGQPQPPPAQQPPPPQPPPATSAQTSGWVGQPPPQPVSPPSAPVDTGPVYENVNVRVAGNDVPSIDVFYND